MDLGNDYNVQKAEKLQAFALFQEEGVEAVKSMFPALVNFVLEHRALSYRKVRELLSAEQVSVNQASTPFLG